MLAYEEDATLTFQTLNYGLLCIVQGTPGNPPSHVKDDVRGRTFHLKSSALGA